MEVPWRKPEWDNAVWSEGRAGSKACRVNIKRKSNSEPLFKSCDRFEDDQTEHKLSAGPSEPQGVLTWAGPTPVTLAMSRELLWVG